MDYDRTRYIRITLLKTLFLLTLIANFIFLPKIRLIPRPLNENTLTSLAYGYVAVERFVPVAIFDQYQPEKILITEETMHQLQLDADVLHQIARINTVEIISKEKEHYLTTLFDITDINDLAYPIDDTTKVVFLTSPLAKRMATIGVVKQGDTIIFFPFEGK